MKDHTLLCQDQVHPAFWQKFVLTGYRQTNTSFIQCLKYIFVVHNDFGNFWTIFIPACMFTAWLYNASYEHNFNDPFWYPLLAYWISICVGSYIGSVAHCFSSKSLRVQAICYMIDYLGIGTYMLTAGLVQYFYERPLEISLLQYKWIFIISLTVLSLNSIFISTTADLITLEYGYLLRACSYFIANLLSDLPFIVRLTLCLYEGRECPNNTLSYHVLAVIFNVFLMFFYTSHIPEKFSPGKFDYIFQSHQLFHLTTVAVMTTKLYYLPKDALTHQNVLCSNSYFQPDIYSIFVPCLITIVAGSAMVLVISWYFVHNEHYLLEKSAKKIN